MVRIVELLLQNEQMHQIIFKFNIFIIFLIRIESIIKERISFYVSTAEFIFTFI